MMCGSPTFNLRDFGTQGDAERPAVALSGTCLSVCWIATIMVNFPGRRNGRFPEDADLLMCEMKAGMQSGKTQGGKRQSQMFNPCSQMEKRRVESLFLKLVPTMILTRADWRSIPGGAVWKGGRAALVVAWWPNPQVAALANGSSPSKVARLRLDALLAPLTGLCVN